MATWIAITRRSQKDSRRRSDVRDQSGFPLDADESAPTTGCGSIVFTGYGIDAPEYGYNDFAGLEVKGKIALVLQREPQANEPNPKFMRAWDTYHAFNWEKIEALWRLSAAGMIVQGTWVPAVM